MSEPTNKNPVEVNERSILLENASVDEVHPYEAIGVSEDDGAEEEDYYINLSESKVLAHKKANVFKVTLGALLFFTSFGLYMSPMIILQINKICRDKFPLDDGNSFSSNTSNPSNIFGNAHCDAKKAQAVQSQTMSLQVLLQSLISILVSGYIGRFSDLHGRKLTLIIAFSITSIGIISTTFLVHDFIPFSLPLFSIAASIDALTGGVKGIISTLRSYVLDIVEPSERVTSLSTITGSLYFGMACGPLLSVFLNKMFGIGDYGSLYVACATMVLTVLIFIFFIPETHFVHHKRHLVTVQQPQKTSFFTVFDIFKSLKLLWIRKTATNPNPWRQRIRVFVLLAINILHNNTVIVTGQTSVLYATLVFKWKSANIGYFMACMGSMKAFNSFVVAPLIVNYLKKHGYINDYFEKKGIVTKTDINVVRISGLLSLLGIGLILVSKHTIGLYIAAMIGSFDFMLIPTLQSCFVKVCAENIYHQEGETESRVGELFGALTILDYISLLVISTSLMLLFSKTSGTYPKTSFIVIFCMILVSISFTWLVGTDSTKVPLEHEDSESDVDDSEA